MRIVALWRGSAVIRRVVVALSIIGLVVLLTLLRRSAVLVLQQSSTISDAGPQASITPLVDLTGVQIRTRQAGHAVVDLDAARLTLYKDLHTASLIDITNGIAYRAGIVALHFAAGRADVQVAPNNAAGGLMRLSGDVEADATEGNVPVHISTTALDWEWPRGVISTLSPVHAVVAHFGSLECANLQVSLPTRTLTFGAFQATIPGAVLPLTPTSSAAKPPANGDDDTKVRFEGSEGGVYTNNDSILTIHGPVKVIQGNVTMQTIGVVYNSKTKVAHALSPVKIVDDQNTLTGDEGEIDFSTHIATVNKNVHLNATPAPAKKTEQNGNSVDDEAKKPTQLQCDHMTYNYRTKLADASGHLTVLQTDRTVTADTGHYDANTQIVTLHGNVDGKSTDGKHLTAPEAIVSVKQDDEWIQVKGPITYEFPISDQDNPAPAKSKKSKATDAARTATPASSSGPPAPSSATTTPQNSAAPPPP